MDFWLNLKKPFFCLAPMDEVTDTVFRQIVAKAGKPDVFFTEFTNVDGLQSTGRDKLLPRLKFTDIERPIVAQIFGLNPENYFKTAKQLKDMGFDGIDINMGCPEKSVVKNGSCAGLIDNPVLAKEIIEATIEGANGLPVSVKTRIGVKTIKTEEWVGFLLGFNLSAITVHGRTAKEMSKVPCHWEEIGKAVKLRDQSQVKGRNKTLIIGNGDIGSYQEGLEKVKEFGVDGIMIGRGVLKNIWIFNPEIDPAEKACLDRLGLLLVHINLFQETFDSRKNFAILKKFCKAYINGFDGAAELRGELMETASLEELREKIVVKVDDRG